MLEQDWSEQADIQERESVLRSKSPLVKKEASDGFTPTILGAEDEDRYRPSVASVFKNLGRRGNLVGSRNCVGVSPWSLEYASRIYSARAFEDLNIKAPLLKGVYKYGYTIPSKIQAATLPILLAEPPRNIISWSQPGTGKTTAFVLAFLSRVDVTKDYPQVLCLCPTQELAIHTAEVVGAMSRYLKGIKIQYVIPGQNLLPGQLLNEHILVGTPGKVFNWAFSHKAFDLAKISVFVLDEADVMVSYQDDKDQIYCIQKHLSAACQVMCFSAIYTNDIMSFAKKVVPRAMHIGFNGKDEMLDTFFQCYLYCSKKTEKFHPLTNLYGALSIGEATILCHTRKEARWLETKILAHGLSVALFSGEISMKERSTVMDMYQQGKFKAAVSTKLIIKGKQGIAVKFRDGKPSIRVMYHVDRHFGMLDHQRDVDIEETHEDAASTDMVLKCRPECWYCSARR